jgi:hypothetical protein
MSLLGLLVGLMMPGLGGMSLHSAPPPAPRETGARTPGAASELGGAPIASMQATAPDPAQDDAGPDAAATYEALRAAGLDLDRVLRVANLEITRGPATFVLTEGHWLPLEPVAGRVTGAVFLGAGRLFYEPPSGVERDQLEKFTGERTLEEEFEQLYLRFTDATAEFVAGTRAPEGGRRDVAGAVPADDAAAVAGEALRLREQVADHFREHSGNPDGRVLVDLIDGRDGLFDAWIERRRGDPLYFSQNSMGDDFYRLNGWSRRADRFDVWGGFGAVEPPAARPIHYDLDLTLRREKVEAARADLELQVTAPGRRALQFDAHPLVEVHEVLDEAGEPLFFAREPAKDDAFESTLTVVFPQPLPVDRPVRVGFVYGGELIDSVYGRGEYAIKVTTGWFPTIGYLQRATFDMTFRVDKGDKLFASGELVSDEIVDDRRVARFHQRLPVAFVSFNYGAMETRIIEVEDAPPITVFGNTTGFGGDMLFNVGVDVGNSLVMFSQMFGSYPFSYMSATRIPYSHGQGFPGLLHLAAGSFVSEVPGHTEAFRGHETAHQWWGHIVGWKSYRDQWISEGFAEYSGALYAAVYRDDPGLLDDMTAAWRNDVFKRGNAGFRRFGMPSGLTRSNSEGSWSGPIALGTRLSSSESPIDYAMLVYEKGAYVLHMLRMLMYDWTTSSDEAWRNMMRDFVASHAGGEASTESFRAVVEKHFGVDMGWFFDQWVYGTAVPTYHYAWTTEEGAGGRTVLKLRVRQTVEPDVPFRMYVPVRIETGDDRFAVLRVEVNEPLNEFSFELPAGTEVRDLLLNPRNAVLAEVTSERW